MNLTRLIEKTKAIPRDFLRREKNVLLLIFVIGVATRGLFELIDVSYPIGPDTLSYAGDLKIFMTRFDWDVLYFGPPLLSAFATLVVLLTGLDYLLVWKIVPPLINGFLVTSFAFFLLKSLGFSKQKTLFASFILMSSIAFIYRSYTIGRQQFATAFFFLFLTYYSMKDHKKTWLFALMVVLSHFIISILTVGVIVFDVLLGLREEGFKAKSVFLPVFIGVTLFSVTFVLPAFSSNNFVSEFTDYFLEYTSLQSTGKIYLKGGFDTVMHQVMHHFNWYFTTMGSAYISIFALFGWFLCSDNRKRILNCLTLPLMLSSFIPIYLWTRSQHLLVYLIVIFVSNLFYGSPSIPHRDFLSKMDKRNRTFLMKTRQLAGFAFLFLLITGGVSYASSYTETSNYKYANLAYEDVENLREVFSIIDTKANRTDVDYLLISSHYSSSTHAILFFNEKDNWKLVTDYCSYPEEGEDNNIYLHVSVRGNFFYRYKNTTMIWDITDFAGAFIVDDGNFNCTKFQPMLSYSEKIYEKGNIYAYEVKLGD